MSRTLVLRRQHDTACEIVKEMAGELAKPQPDAYWLAMRLAKLTGLLRIHFAQEDKTLYPYMIASSNAAAAARAEVFKSSMGGLAEQFDTYAKRWTSSSLIRDALPRFRAESRAILAALAKRIEQEDRELYPLADAITPDQIGRTA